MKTLLHTLGIALLLTMSSQAFAQDLSRAGSTMQVQPLIDGCTVPGGLQPITSSDGPNDAPFWCGPPPYCLTMVVGSPERCHIVPGSRNGGTTGVRNPQDLICDVTNINPTGPTHAFPGRCPVPPTLGATVNGVQAATVSQGANVTLRVNTANTAPLSAPTALTMACTGTNAAISPFNQTNLIAYAGQDHTFPAIAAGSAGNTACTITATNAAGSATYNVSFNATPTVTTPAPTVQAEFTNSPVAVGSTRVSLRTRTTNATGNITWRCTGIWNFTDTRPSSNGAWHTTTHNQGSGSAAGRSSTCTFTATGPGGTGTTTATWRAVAASGGGTGGSGGTVTPAPQTTTWIFRACRRESGNRGNGGGCAEFKLGVANASGTSISNVGSVTCNGTLTRRGGRPSGVPASTWNAAVNWSQYWNGNREALTMITDSWTCVR